jgi:hypothetical protein
MFKKVLAMAMAAAICAGIAAPLPVLASGETAAASATEKTLLGEWFSQRDVTEDSNIMVSRIFYADGTAIEIQSEYVSPDNTNVGPYRSGEQKLEYTWSLDGNIVHMVCTDGTFVGEEHDLTLEDNGQDSQLLVFGKDGNVAVTYKKELPTISEGLVSLPFLVEKFEAGLPALTRRFLGNWYAGSSIYTFRSDGTGLIDTPAADSDSGTQTEFTFRVDDDPEDADITIRSAARYSYPYYYKATFGSESGGSVILEEGGEPLLLTRNLNITPEQVQPRELSLEEKLQGEWFVQTFRVYNATPAMVSLLFNADGTGAQILNYYMPGENTILAPTISSGEIAFSYTWSLNDNMVSEQFADSENPEILTFNNNEQGSQLVILDKDGNIATTLTREPPTVPEGLVSLNAMIKKSVPAVPILTWRFLGKWYASSSTYTFNSNGTGLIDTPAAGSDPGAQTEFTFRVSKGLSDEDANISITLEDGTTLPYSAIFGGTNGGWNSGSVMLEGSGEPLLLTQKAS